jgi:O-antigen/teichoic acid export membrane protein
MPTPVQENAQPAGAAGNVKQRLVRGFGASALGPVVTLIIQVVKVPIFLHMWGATLYGEWLILSAIPTYLALSDIGFGNVAGSDMTMNVAAGKHDAALDSFQSTWVLVCSVSLVMMALVSVGSWFVPWDAWMKLSVISNHHAAQIMLVFSAYVLFSLQYGILDSGFRCDGNFALGTTCLNIVRFSEAAIATIPLLCGGGPLMVAATYLLVRIIGCVVLMLLLRSKSPWIRYGIQHANLGSIRRLASPAFAFMAFPIGSALSLQGFTVVVAASLGPVAVVAFSTMRTLSRVGYQVLAVIGRAIWPELSAAFGSGNVGLARKLHRRACQVAFTLSLGCSLVLSVASPYFYGSWTRHAVHFDPLTFNILLLVVLVNSFWATSAVVALASNQHEKMAIAYVIGTSISLGLAWALMKPFGTAGAAASLLCIDLSMAWIVIRVALRLVADTPGGFLASMFTVPNLGGFLRREKGNAA